MKIFFNAGNKGKFRISCKYGMNMVKKKSGSNKMKERKM